MDNRYKEFYKAFRADEHEWLQNKFIYVTINSTIQRLNEACPDWSLQQKHFNMVLNPSKGKNGEYESVMVAELSIPNMGTRMGTGAASNFDPDNSAKSAQAYALRKAANQFGVAHYLLMNPENESDLVKYLLANDWDDREAMKQACTMLLDIRKVEVSADGFINTFDVTLDELKNDEEIFKKILKQENRI